MNITVDASQINTKPSILLDLKTIHTDSADPDLTLTELSIDGPFLPSGEESMITYPSTDVSKDFTCPNVNGIITCKYFEVNNSKLNTYSFKFKAVSLTLNPFWTGTNYLTVACAA